MTRVEAVLRPSLLHCEVAQTRAARATQTARAAQFDHHTESCWTHGFACREDVLHADALLAEIRCGYMHTPPRTPSASKYLYICFIDDKKYTKFQTVLLQQGLHQGLQQGVPATWCSPRCSPCCSRVGFLGDHQVGRWRGGSRWRKGRWRRKRRRGRFVRFHAWRRL